MSRPPRGFPDGEFRDRLARAQSLMRDAGLAALLLTTEPEIRYFTGFLTRFWESPTRPWFLVVPADDDPVAVIPSIGAHLMGQTWIGDIRTWHAPDYDDDGVSLLADTLCELVPATASIGVPGGLETHIRMPHDSWLGLQTATGRRKFVGDAGILRRLRMVKSSREIDKIRTACDIAGRAFARVPEMAARGETLDQMCRRFQALCLDEGADWVAYLAVGAGQGGYRDVISPPTGAGLDGGDVLMLDTGVVWDGYYCDFDRNFAVPPVAAAVDDAHKRLIEATQVGFDAARTGAEAADVFHAMNRVLTGGTAGETPGRLGHGLGMQLTEGLSLLPADRTVLEPGMVLTLEPSVSLPGQRMLVHEEDIVITAGGAEYLTQPAPQALPKLEIAA
ncbi:MAG: Xaa-Pro peptidase family protein [Rhodobacter sp.]|nr:Xaa-Pro peptidase family protein [Rhodobacter sp.]